MLTEKGLSQRELSIVRDGVFEVLDGDRRVGVLGRGDAIDEMASFGSAVRRTASACAARDGEVLSLRRGAIDELRAQDPACAADILFQLGRALADRTSGWPGVPGPA